MGGGQLVNEPVLAIHRQAVVFEVNNVRLTPLGVNVLLLHAAGVRDPVAARWLGKSQRSIAAVRGRLRKKVGLSDRRSFHDFATVHMSVAFGALCSELNAWLGQRGSVYPLPIAEPPVRDADRSGWLALFEAGMPMWRIAERSGWSLTTVERHLRRVRRQRALDATRGRTREKDGSL